MNEKNINTRIKKIYNLTNNNWRNYSKKIQLISFDNKNKMLNNLIYKILVNDQKKI